MQLFKSVAVASAVLATAVIAAPSSERLPVEARLLGSPAGSPSLPSKDGFYRPDGTFSSKANGSVLKSRKVKPTSSNAAAAYQLLYKTTDALGKADATVVTILVPKTPKSPPQIVGLQIPEDSVSVDCAPSAALTSGTNSPASFGLTFTNQGLDGSLSNGYYVVIPDHEGSKAASFVGPVEGHAVLDGLLAATSFTDAIPGVTRKTPIAIGGYSGGAHATAWAAQLYPKYAPSLNIKGQVIGGTPVDLNSTLYYLNKGTYAGFAAVGIVGEYLAYPDIKQYIDANVYPNGTALFNKLMNNQCILDVAFGYSGTDLFSYFKTANPLDDPVPQKRLKENLLGGDGSKLTIGTVMYHGTTDDIIPYQDAVNYAKSQCSKGAKVHFYADAGKQHIPEELSRGDDLVKWLDQTLQGTVDNSCNLV
ncbi:hypothetical protein CF319_g4983 [Tilletia indica]|uniref:triacylglycerol lipase n=2 Tax=Tilletia TaxID=13289 RepID=A0A8X7N608_9BASI|nr:hypothetical protein CF327_g3915 [Tilletia walkeri]KAE8221698.1 hypothetical protein CF319_g4983 [Tilletia indica]KAE8230420.1 hypothetical protein CF326_g4582 [Tilletia indica]KAE8258857.1 hypothetical protein A4X13_0g1386 [Tilletia indica]KAE8266265.1 hypothetical protein A4X09_0g6080 [Tilletia walkeri]